MHPGHTWLGGSHLLVVFQVERLPVGEAGIARVDGTAVERAGVAGPSAAEEEQPGIVDRDGCDHGPVVVPGAEPVNCDVPADRRDDLGLYADAAVFPSTLSGQRARGVYRIVIRP